MASRTGAIGVDIDGHQQSIDSVSDHHLTGGHGRLRQRAGMSPEQLRAAAQRDTYGLVGLSVKRVTGQTGVHCARPGAGIAGEISAHPHAVNRPAALLDVEGDRDLRGVWVAEAAGDAPDP